MDIVRDFSEELIDVQKVSQERMVKRAMASGLITQAGGAWLLKEIWGTNA